MPGPKVVGGSLSNTDSVNSYLHRNNDGVVLNKSSKYSEGNPIYTARWLDQRSGGIKQIRIDMRDTNTDWGKLRQRLQDAGIRLPVEQGNETFAGIQFTVDADCKQSLESDFPQYFSPQGITEVDESTHMTAAEVRDLLQRREAPTRPTSPKPNLSSSSSSSAATQRILLMLDFDENLTTQPLHRLRQGGYAHSWENDPVDPGTGLLKIGAALDKVHQNFRQLIKPGVINLLKSQLQAGDPILINTSGDDPRTITEFFKANGLSESEAEKIHIVCRGKPSPKTQAVLDKHRPQFSDKIHFYGSNKADKAQYMIEKNHWESLHMIFSDDSKGHIDAVGRAFPEATVIQSEGGMYHEHIKEMSEMINNHNQALSQAYDDQSELSESEVEEIHYQEDPALSELMGKYNALLAEFKGAGLDKIDSDKKSFDELKEKINSSGDYDANFETALVNAIKEAYVKQEKSLFKSKVLKAIYNVLNKEGSLSSVKDEIELRVVKELKDEDRVNKKDAMALLKGIRNKSGDRSSISVSLEESVKSLGQTQEQQHKDQLHQAQNKSRDDARQVESPKPSLK